MRCYFMRGGHIAAVEMLDPDEGDDGCIRRAHVLFEARKRSGLHDGFEVWDQARFVFRYPTDLKTPERGA